MSSRAWPSVGHSTMIQCLKLEVENTQHGSSCEIAIIKMVYVCVPGTAAVSGIQFTSAIASCIGLLGPGPVTPLTVTYICCFTEKHKKLAVGRSVIISALSESCVIINSLELV